MKAKAIVALIMALFVMFAMPVLADETVSAVYPEDGACESVFFGATPRPDGEAVLMEDIPEETVALTLELYNNFLKFAPGMFLYSDEGLKNYDSLGIMTGEELAYVKQKAVEITRGCTDADEKIRAVAEYVALNVCYDYDYTLHDKPAEEVYVSAYDVLVNESSVCHGYSLSCMVLLQSVGIPCVFVRSPNHAWNLAYNGERWILFDTTWMSSGRMENGVLDKGEHLWEGWYDFTIETAVGDKNHTIDTIDIMIANGELTRFPIYTKIKSFEIPDGVTAIGDYVFCECDSIEKVVVPDGVVSMGDFVFYGCNELECVNLGNSVNGIGYAAFCYCDSLEKINIPEKVAYIGYSAFLGCEDLDEIIIPDSVESIGEQAFANCYDLERIETGNGVKSIGNVAFFGCNSIESIVIGDGITILDHWSFGKSLENIVIGDGVTVIGDYAFSGCDNLKNVDMGNGVQSIGYAAFYKCNSLACIEISDSVKSIGEYAFCECASLADVSMGRDLESIGRAAFYVCGKLGTVRLCHGLKNVGYAAFNGTKIKNVYYTGNKDDWNGIVFDAFNTELTSANRSYVPNTSMELSGNTLKLECKNIPQSGCDLFICSYAGGRIKDAYMRTVDKITDEVFTLSDGVDTVKVFVLGCDGSLVPLTAGEALEI